VLPKNLLVSLVLVGSCSDGVDRSAPLPLPGAEDSVTDSAEEQPALVLRCLDGMMDAYLVMGPSVAVPVKLDSAPPCSQRAP
jgi:hypothetical protein